MTAPQSDNQHVAVCPICYSANIETTLKVLVWDNDREMSFIRCADCGFSLELPVTEKFIIQVWNSLYKKHILAWHKKKRNGG
jgi:hypothetical protein